MSDGETEKGLKRDEQSAFIREPLENPIAGDGWNYLHACRNIQGSYSILECMRERKNVVVSEPDGSSILLETAPRPKGEVEYAPFGFRVTLDKTHGAMPVVIERTKIIQGQIFTQRRLRVLEWKGLGMGVWVPVRIITQYFNSDPDWGAFGALYSEETLVVDVAQSSWNKEIPEATFTLPLPTGVKVLDTRRGVQFVTGKPDPGKNLDDLIAHARKVVPYPVVRPPRPAKPWWRKWWSLSAFAVSAAGAALFVIFRIRRQRKGNLR